MNPRTAKESREQRIEYEEFCARLRNLSVREARRTRQEGGTPIAAYEAGKAFMSNYGHRVVDRDREKIIAAIAQEAGL